MYSQRIVGTQRCRKPPTWAHGDYSRPCATTLERFGYSHEGARRRFLNDLTASSGSALFGERRQARPPAPRAIASEALATGELKRYPGGRGRRIESARQTLHFLRLFLAVPRKAARQVRKMVPRRQPATRVGNGATRSRNIILSCHAACDDGAVDGSRVFFADSSAGQPLVNSDDRSKKMARKGRHTDASARITRCGAG